VGMLNDGVTTATPFFAGVVNAYTIDVWSASSAPSVAPWNPLNGGSSATVSSTWAGGVVTKTATGLLSATPMPSSAVLTPLVPLMPDYFAMHVYGYFFVSTAQAGTVGFYMTADDDGYLFVDGTLIVSNTYADATPTGSCSLTAGWHRLDVNYVQSGGGYSLAVEWQPNGAGSYTAMDSIVRSVAPPAQVVLNLGSVKALSSVTLWTGDWGATYNSVQLETSANGSTWTTVYGPTAVSTTAMTASNGFVVQPWCFARGVAILATSRATWDVRRGGGGRQHEPVRIRRGVLGAERDLVVSACHGVMLRGRLVPAANVEGVEFAPDAAPDGVVEYHNLRLPQPTDMLVAEGVACEGIRCTWLQ
jgi:hypothetical protein